MALAGIGRTDDLVIQNLLALAEGKNSGYLYLEVNQWWIYDMRPTAAQALGELGRLDDAVRILSKLVQGNGVDETAKSEAARALGYFGKTKEGIDGLLELVRRGMMYNDTKNITMQALEQLGQKDARVALEFLELCEDQDLCDMAYGALKRVVGNQRHTTIKDP